MQPPFGLKDLPGSAKSAMRFAEWLRDDLHGYRPPEAPVGTIRLLLAPTAGELDSPPEPSTVALPNRQTALDALCEWSADCCSDSLNVAVLYVAGHGFRETLDGALVLMHDAGRSPRVFDEALDIEGIREALRGPTAPRRQYYFVDACRELSRGLTGVARPIRGGVAPDASQGERHPAPVYYAAAADTSAFQDANGSIFVDALLTCFRLDAVRRRDATTDEWVVRGTHLHEALDRRVGELAAQGDRDQMTGSGGTPSDAIFTLADHPKVPFDLDVRPIKGRAGAFARVFNEELDVEAVPKSPIPIRNREVLAGAWSVSLNYDGAPSPYQPFAGTPIFVDPPRYNRPLSLR